MSLPHSDNRVVVLEALLGARVAQLDRVGGQHGVEHWQGVLDGGRRFFVKAARLGPGALCGLSAGFRAEACGLRWLSDAGAVPVPEVLAVRDAVLVLSWIPQEPPAPAAAERFGRELAALHAAGAEAFGAQWPGGVIAGLPLGEASAASWPGWYADQRLVPFARRAMDAGALSAADVALIEAVAARAGELAGPAEPPSRIHGDCWSGNVLWSVGRGVLVDPAAHGGHRETDLAMLALFGAPFLDRILAAYREAAPLAEGWQDRIALHQLHPLLVHCCLFGSGYRAPLLAAARTALAR